MPRKMRPAKARHGLPAAEPWEITYLLTGKVGDEDVIAWILATAGGPFQVGGRLHTLWLELRDDLLRTWIRRHPGTRPYAWWHAGDAPKWKRGDQPSRVQAITWLNCAEPRKRLGGIGDPSYEYLNVVPEFDHGLPVSWIDAWDARYYRGEALDVAGAPIGQEFVGHDFKGLAPDPANLPTFESEPAYLLRHNLLTDGERRRLPASAFDPVRISVAPEDDAA